MHTSCGCAQHCFDKVLDDGRKALMDSGMLGNFDIQNTLYVHAPLWLCKNVKYKRKYTKNEESC